jgi:peptide/nickel transport system substrate-binding protein
LDLFFWTPLPAHIFVDGISFSELRNSALLLQFPLSYGPFMVSSWDADQVSLTRNPYYYQGAQGLPLIDRVLFKVIPGGRKAAWDAMQAGACDILDTSFGFENEPDLLAEIQMDENINVIHSQRMDWTQLVFGIKPASYDDYYNPQYGDRPDFFSDPMTRKAVAACIDRSALVNTVAGGLGELWYSFISPDQSALSADEGIIYDTQEAQRLLQEMGWRDVDSNPETPLEAWGVPNVPNGTQFSVDLLINPSGFQKALGQLIQEDLSNCGIRVDLVEMSPAELYAPGPEGPLFGRDFDLALISWQPLNTFDCGYYQSWGVVSDENDWIGTNIAGFSDQVYDSLCTDAQLALPNERLATQALAERNFIENYPAIPLISAPEVLIISTSICLDQLMTSEADFFDHLEYHQLIDCP